MRKIYLMINACVLGGLSLLVGCHEGPLARFGHLNPYAVRRWQAEEEQIISLSDKRNRIEKIVSHADSMAPRQADEAAHVLRDMIQEESILMVRVDATRALGVLPTPRAGEVLLGLIHDSDSAVRVAACETLGLRPASEAIPILEQAITNETDIDVRLAAVRALAGFTDNREAVRVLGMALDDPEPALQFRAMESLSTVTGRDYGHDGPKWRAFVQGNPPPEEGTSVVGRLRQLF